VQFKGEAVLTGQV